MSDRVVTVTANPAIDRTVWIPGFRAGEVNRVVRDERSPGGKGVNVAAFLTRFGVPCCVTGFLGALNATLFERFFAESGIEDAFVRIDDETRTGIKIADDDAGTTTDINFPGFAVDEPTVAALERRIAELEADWVVLAGSLPPSAPADLYRRLAEAARGRVALDTSGPALREALGARPDVVKPNREELEQLVGRPLPGRDDLVAAARELGAATVVVSLGGDGALFVREDEVVFAEPASVRVASTVGAGDAMVAGTVAGTLRGLGLDGVAALATAFSADAISRIGPVIDPEAVERGAREITVRRLET